MQHGASTLPKEAFNEFSKADAIEVHLATGFQNLIFDHPALPASLKEQVYTWLRENRQEERKEGMTDEQFYYTTRKRGFGSPGIKEAWWNMPAENKAAIMTDLQEEFRVMFERLGIAGTAAQIDATVTPRQVRPADAGVHARHRLIEPHRRAWMTGRRAMSGHDIARRPVAAFQPSRPFPSTSERKRQICTEPIVIDNGVSRVGRPRVLWDEGSGTRCGDIVFVAPAGECAGWFGLSR